MAPFSPPVTPPPSQFLASGPQLPVAMESGCCPTPLLLGRHLVARRHLLRHLGSQRACSGLSEGGRVPGGPADFGTWEVCCLEAEGSE